MFFLDQLSLLGPLLHSRIWLQFKSTLFICWGLWAAGQPVAGAGFLLAWASSRTTIHALVMSSSSFHLAREAIHICSSTHHRSSSPLDNKQRFAIYLQTKMLNYITLLTQGRLVLSQFPTFALSVPPGSSCFYSSSEQVRSHTVQTELGTSWKTWKNPFSLLCGNYSGSQHVCNHMYFTVTDMAGFKERSNTFY